jgi:uncharacterized protein YndB with AHSA1/START domain
VSDNPSLVRMERVVHAPRHHVYIAWRKPERMARWWSAEHAGGAAVRGIDGSYRVGGVVVKVLEDLPLERLVFLWGDGDDTATLVTVTFREIEGATRIAIHQTVAPRRERVLLGGLDRLAVLLRDQDLSC